ncbi:hypothetical protein MASR2M74_14580 [Paracoccaceae bacterium]
MLRPALFCALAFAAAPTFAQTGNFELELNTSADVEGACRLTFVATNNTGKSLTKADYEVAVFNASGAVSQILVLEFGELPLSKTRVVQFDLPQTKCEDLSRILVNTADACESGDGPLDVCMKDLSASSRIPSMPFGL